MNKIILLLIGVTIIGAAAFAGFLTPPKPKSNIPATATSTACVDHDPPDTSDSVTLSSGVKYNLIKENAQIVDKYKVDELAFIETLNGKKVYKIAKTNYLGDAVNIGDGSLVFVLQNAEDPAKSPYIFKIYLQENRPIPEYIKHCRSTGGTTKVVVGETANFPPDAFNKTDIVGLSDPSVAPAYVHSGPPASPTTMDFVNRLGAQNIGRLPIPVRNNQQLPLFFHLGTFYLIDGNNAYVYSATDNPISLTGSKKSLQLKKVIFVQTPTYSWWTPACKPAIYLYPTKKENVNVKVRTSGFFTLTIPDYNKLTGWDVVANPDGIIESNSNQYPYLYYESKVPDSKITKPKNGYVITRNELSQLFPTLLPKLGLNKKEMKEFIDYWTKALPFSPYYFVGIMDKESIDQIEPLDINPSPDSIIRVRLYFEMLDKSINVKQPVITTPQRNGFTVVEWGAMVKTDKNSPFTCSQ